MKIVGLCGYAGAGKDYVCDLIRTQADNADRYAQRVAFADGVKYDIEDALGVPRDSLDALRSKPYSEEIRWLLQQWGTELRRAQDEDYWVKNGIERAQAEWDFGGADLIIFTDVRFENEAQAIRDAGGLVMQVIATDEIRQERLGGWLPPTHASEVIDFETDGNVPNNGMTEFPVELTIYLEEAFD